MSKKFKILILEDDVRYFQTLSLGLQDFADFSHARTELEFFRLLHLEGPAQKSLDTTKYNSILIDLHLDGEFSGKRIAQKVLQSESSPILFLTSDNCFETKISCLEMGVSDFLWKTMPIEEIRLRIRNTIKNQLASDSRRQPQIQMGNLYFQIDSDRVVVAGHSVEVSRTELRILRALAESEQNLLTKDEFLRLVWNQNQVSEGAVHTAIYQLNKKLSTWSKKISSLGGKLIKIEDRHPTLAIDPPARLDSKVQSR